MNTSEFVTQTNLISVVIPVYRDGGRAIAAVKAILAQSLPENMEREVIVIDDGSDDDTASLLSEFDDTNVRVHRLNKNQGRSVARNTGASLASGGILVFMDCDCVPDEGFLTAHFNALSDGSTASTGQVFGVGTGFWNRYQADSSNRRREQHGQGLSWSGSSQNLAVRREAFNTVGGFDIAYHRYGFEDRDLLLRLSKLGPIIWTDEAIVRHQDQLSLAHVTAKMREAGEYSSAKFADRHPDAYHNLGYSAIDANGKPFSQTFAPISKTLAALIASVFDGIHCERWLPYSIAKPLVRAATALSYFSGTADRS